MPPTSSIPLDADQLTTLWTAFASGTEQQRRGTRDTLLINFSPLVRYVAHRVSQTLPASVDHADLESYGMFGLIDAIDKFEPGRGFKFETYAISRIKGNILDELRAIDWVPRSVRAKAREIDRATAELEAKLNRSPTDVELAAEMDITVELIHNARSRTASSYIASLDERTSSDDEGSITLGNLVPDRREDPQQALLGVGDIQTTLAEAMSPPVDRERVELTLYYLEGLTLAQIGEVIGVTESRVCRIHPTAIFRLRVARTTGRSGTELCWLRSRVGPVDGLRSPPMGPMPRPSERSFAIAGSWRGRMVMICRCRSRHRAAGVIARECLFEPIQLGMKPGHRLLRVDLRITLFVGDPNRWGRLGPLSVRVVWERRRRVHGHVMQSTDVACNFKGYL